MASASASIVSVGSVSYYVPPRRIRIPPTSRYFIIGSAPDFEDKLVPVTLLVFPDGSEISAQSLSSTVEVYLRTDDVFSHFLLEHIYLVIGGISKSMKLDNLCIAIFRYWGTKSVHVVQPEPDAEQSLRGGPYFASNKGLHQAWRLFEDKNGAFVCPVVPVDGKDG